MCCFHNFYKIFIASGILYQTIQTIWERMIIIIFTCVNLFNAHNDLHKVGPGRIAHLVRASLMHQSCGFIL